MGVREEKEALIKGIAEIEQSLGQSRAKVLSLLPKIEASRASMDRCADLKRLSQETVEYMKKGDLIDMKVYTEMVISFKNNKNLEVKFKNDIFLYEKLLFATRQEISYLENLLETASKKIASIAVVMPFKP